MAHPKIKRALISVYDKTGIVEFARALHSEFGIEIISTGGTAKLLKESGIPVTLVEEITGFPEMLDGRVKTLHPRIHAGILADRDNPEHMRQLAEQGIKPIDMVVVNLYPFEKTVADPNCTFEQAIEMIDIGGPCLLRAAAKNHKHVIPIARQRSQDYVLGELRESGDVLPSGRAVLASIAFEVTTEYDSRVEAYFTHVWTKMRCGQDTQSTADLGSLPTAVTYRATRQLDCRYGENPHQMGALYCPREEDSDFGVLTCQVGKSDAELSFNNLADASAAFELCRDVSVGLGSETTAVVVFVKHTNACGVGIGVTPEEAYARAYCGDANAAMGGILACNFPVDSHFAAMVMDTFDQLGKASGAGGFFVEVWLATSFVDDEVVHLIRQRKPWGSRVRLLKTGDAGPQLASGVLECQSITGGILMQTRDLVGLNEEQWNVVTKRSPTVAERADLRLAWLIAKRTKSNAISICKDGMLIGNGAGQMSRVMSCRIATWLAKENRHEDKLPGSAAASDAFFPFADGPNLLMDAGVTAIIQPGGSKRDQEVIDACDARGAAMIFTGTRHFKH